MVVDPEKTDSGIRMPGTITGTTTGKRPPEPPYSAPMVNFIGGISLTGRYYRANPTPSA